MGELEVGDLLNKKSILRISLTIALSWALALAVTNPASGAGLLNPDDPYLGKGIGLNIVENYVNNGHQASAISGYQSENGQVSNIFDCSILSICLNKSDINIQGNLLLPVCQTATDKDCLIGLEVSRNGSSWQSAEFRFEAPALNSPGQENVGLPRTGGVSIWRVAGDSQFEEMLLSVHFELQTNYQKAINRFVHRSVAMNIIPFEFRSGNYKVPTVSEFTDPSGRRNVSIGAVPSDCAWVSEIQCGMVTEFPSDLKLRATFNLRREIGGWLAGRVQKPEVQISDLKNGQVHISVSGSPAVVPKIFASTGPETAADISERAFPNLNRNYRGIVNSRSNIPSALTAIEAFRELAGDSSVGNYLTWSFISEPVTSSCISANTGFQGFVSTNASYYQATPPDYSAGFLNYTVAGYHFGPDKKTPNLGRYDLVMTSKFAKCLYGLKRIPRYATVRIASENGNTSASTAVLSEKNGWLKLSASGFTFSTKTIKIKLK